MTVNRTIKGAFTIIYTSFQRFNCDRYPSYAARRSSSGISSVFGTCSIRIIGELPVRIAPFAVVVVNTAVRFTAKHILVRQRHTAALTIFIRFHCLTPLFFRYFIGISLDRQAEFPRLSVGSFERKARFSRFLHIGMHHIILDLFHINDFDIAVAAVLKGDRVCVVKGRLLAAREDIRAVHRRIEQTDHRQCDDSRRADRRARDPYPLISEDTHGIQDHRRRAEQGDQDIPRERELKF